MPMQRLLPLFFVLLGLPAHADEVGSSWLKRIDASARLTDAHLKLTVQATDAKGQQYSRELEIWQKGTERRLVRMMAPARLKGVGLLVGPGDSLHLFLPSYPPARRVVGSKRSDAFMGTDFAIEDLSRMTFSDHYEAIVEGTEGPNTRLLLTPVKDSGEATVRLLVRSTGAPDILTIEHMDAQGSVTRRLRMEEYRDVGGTRIAHALWVENLKSGRDNHAQVTSAEIGTGLSDQIFTVNHLEHP